MMTENQLLRQQYLLDSGKITTLTKKVITWIMRKHPNFDPDAMCPYTGMALFKWPVDDLRMGFWREDGSLTRVRAMTLEELNWLQGNPEEFAKDHKGFRNWLKNVLTVSKS